MAKKLPKETRIEIAKAFKRIRPEVNTDDEAYAIMKVHFPNVGRTSFHKFKTHPIPTENTVIKGKDFNLEFDCDLVKEIERLGKEAGANTPINTPTYTPTNQIEDFELDDEVFEEKPIKAEPSFSNTTRVHLYQGVQDEPIRPQVSKVINQVVSENAQTWQALADVEISSEIKQEPQVKADPFETLATFAKSELEKQVVLTYDKVGQDLQLAAQSLGLSFKQTENAFYRVKSRAALQGFAPEYALSRIIPDTHYLKGASTLYRDGVPVLQWVKSDKKAEVLAKQAKELAEALAEDLPQIEPRKATGKYDKELLAVYPMGDPHFGLFSWGEETGEDFDLKIAERDLCQAVHRLVDAAPACDEALIINLGDFFHADNNDGRTSRSGHSLDTDTRWAKVLRVGVKAIKQCIESALTKHKQVSIINAIGNHDDHTAMFLSVALANMYENEPRVNVIDNPTITHYYRFGNNLLGVHHGHTIKMDKLPLQMATDRPQDWGETKYRFFFSGHVHHDSKKEFNGVIVESFRTLAARDAWHTSMGYRAGRDMKCIVFHKNFGEIQRSTVNVAMLAS